MEAKLPLCVVPFLCASGVLTKVFSTTGGSCTFREVTGVFFQNLLNSEETENVFTTGSLVSFIAGKQKTNHSYVFVHMI